MTAALHRLGGLRYGNQSVKYGNHNTYGYDGVERLNALAQAFPATSGSNESWSITYNAASQIKTLISANDGFAWNGGVNASKTYVPNGLNQYASVAGTGFTCVTPTPT